MFYLFMFYLYFCLINPKGVRIDNNFDSIGLFGKNGLTSFSFNRIISPIEEANVMQTFA